MMNNRINSSISLHNELHGFRQGRGTVSTSLEAKLDQKPAGLCHDPLFQLFLHVTKKYNSLSRVRCTEILRGYGLGPKL